MRCTINYHFELKLKTADCEQLSVADTITGDYCDFFDEREK